MMTTKDDVLVLKIMARKISANIVQLLDLLDCSILSVIIEDYPFLNILD